MKKFDLNSALLLICTGLLTVCAYGIFSRPTLEEIDGRIMIWAQHYGAHYSTVNKEKNMQEASMVDASQKPEQLEESE